MLFDHRWGHHGTSLLFQAQQKKANGLPDPNKREGPIKTTQDIYEEGGLKVGMHIISSVNLGFHLHLALHLGVLSIAGLSLIHCKPCVAVLT